MGWDYASELLTPTILLSIPQVIYEQGERWWNDDVDREKLLIRPPELSGNPTSRVIWYQARGMGERNGNLVLRSVFVHTCKWFLHAIKSCDTGLPALLPLRRKACCGFLRPLKIHCICRVWTREPWVQCKHTNHYTTEATVYQIHNKVSRKNTYTN
jgi:hypothetical protein